MGAGWQRRSAPAGRGVAFRGARVDLVGGEAPFASRALAMDEPTS
jgi:hypothetical protein